MKKLRVFGLLAMALLAFAVVISCGDAGGGPTTPPEGPGPTDTTQYPPYQGGTGASGIVINPAAGGTLQRFSLSKSSISIEEGKTFQLEAILVPFDASNVKSVTWSSDTPATAAVSGSGLVTAATNGAGGTPGEFAVSASPAKITATVHFKDDDDDLYYVTADCLVNVYRMSLEGLTDSSDDLKGLDWDIIALFRDHEDANDQTRGAVKTSVEAKIAAAMEQEEIREFGINKDLLPPKGYVGGNPQVRVGPADTDLKRMISIFPLLKGATTFDLGFDYNGWAIAEMTSTNLAAGAPPPAPKPKGTKSGTSMTVGTGAPEYREFICYPIPGLAAAEWPWTVVRVVPAAEITFTVHEDIRDTLDKDALLSTANQATTRLIRFVTQADVYESTNAIFVSDSASEATGPLDYDYKLIAADGGYLSKTFVVQANFTGNKFQLLDAVAQSPKPKYTLAGITLPAASSVVVPTGLTAAYTSWDLGRIASDSYTITLTREDEILDTIAITGIVGPLRHGDTLATTNAPATATHSVAPDILTAANKGAVAAWTWHLIQPTRDNPSPAAVTTATGGKKAYVKIVLEPVAGYAFKSTATGPAVDITCGVLDRDSSDDPVPVLEDYEPTITSFFGTTDATAKVLTIVLAFDVDCVPIAAIPFGGGFFDDEDDGVPQIGAKASVKVALDSPGAGLPAEVYPSWTVTDAGGTFAIAPASYVAKEGDVFIATFTVSALEGYDFNPDTDLDDPFVAPVLADIDGATALTVTPAANLKSVRIVITFTPVPAAT